MANKETCTSRKDTPARRSQDDHQDSDAEFIINTRTKFPIRDWMNTVQCKLSLAQIVTLCPDFGDKMADKIDDLTKATPKLSVNSVSVAWHLPVQIHGQNLAALLDTGSALTLIGEACAQRLGLQTVECRPLIMKMANDTRAIATQYLPTAVLTIGELDIPARIIVMPNVTYDLLLGKDFLTATQASIGMNKDAAHATLTWAGQTTNVQSNRRSRRIRTHCRHDTP